MLLPVIEAGQFKKGDHEDYFICVSKLLKFIEKEEAKRIFSTEELISRVVELLYTRPIYEDRFSEYEDKVLGGLLLVAESLLEIDAALKETFGRSLPNSDQQNGLVKQI